MNYYVIHKKATNFVFFLELKEGVTFSVNDTYVVEKFEDSQYEEAKARALELGYEFDPEDQ